MSETPGSFPPRVDAPRVVAEQRSMTPAARQALYRRVFGGQDGQTVLLDLLVDAAVSAPRPSSLTPDERIHLDGQQWVVLKTMHLAGYGVGDIAGVILTNSMRGLNPDDRHHSSGSDRDDRAGAILPGDNDF